MSGLRPSVDAQVAYQLRIVQGPLRLRVASNTIELSDRQDATAIVCVVTSNGLLVSEEVIGVLTDPTAMLRFRSFIAQGGGLTLHRDI